ncbi:BTAD domain-containing putative transcriptional regulator [Neoroseomonas oryzicola]|uniref:Tetratricopeptide repeat protein n=1 Tax=Neoroseomonas oryzicola TaxID=535904 RepID=A0A9X9WKV8_9PROT|nr:tetratricopeptide repeat protein [Neoroseomonas oryzicola]NKE19848.1 tetratricopeptide repeat protein [Neoroseomonas oryzicola]
MPLRLLGEIGLEGGTGEALRLPTRKTALLLAFLALAGTARSRREALCAAFWPDRGDAQARNSLRQGLAAIRQALATDPETGLRLEGDVEAVHLLGRPEDVDAWQFDALAASTAPEALARAAALWRGDLLEGMTLPEPLDQWFAPHRQRFREKALLLAERLSLAEDGAAVEAGAALAERLLLRDPAAEEAHRALIRLHLRHGRAAAARRQFETCREALRRELDAAPDPQTEALLAQPVPATRAAAPTPEPRGRERPAIIVMPFDNLSGAADDYFVDGVVEEITSALSRVRDFFVIARQSAYTYKGRLVDVRTIGRELGVNYVVEGTVRRGGDRLRITVHLVDPESRAQLWSDRYEGATTDVFEFQDRIAAQVAGAIHPAVRNAEIDAARRRPPGGLRAYDLVLRAMPRIWAQNASDNAEAIATLRQAIEAEPTYGRAHALRAWCHAQAVVYLWSGAPEADRAAAAEAVEAASPLIADDPTALAAAGAAISQCLDDLDRAGAFIEAALALEPNNAWAWARHGWLAIYRDEADRAVESFERSLALNPLDPMAFNLRIGIAVALSLRGDNAEALRILRDVLHQHPQMAWANRQLALMLAETGDMEGARAAIARLRAVTPNASIALLRRTHPIRHLGPRFERMVAAWRAAGLPEA